MAHIGVVSRLLLPALKAKKAATIDASNPTPSLQSTGIPAQLATDQPRIVPQNQVIFRRTWLENLATLALLLGDVAAKMDA